MPESRRTGRTKKYASRCSLKYCLPEYLPLPTSGKKSGVPWNSIEEGRLRRERSKTSAPLGDVRGLGPCSASSSSSYSAIRSAWSAASCSSRRVASASREAIRRAQSESKADSLTPAASMSSSARASSPPSSPSPMPPPSSPLPSAPRVRGSSSRDIRTRGCHAESIPTTDAMPSRTNASNAAYLISPECSAFTACTHSHPSSGLQGKRSRRSVWHKFETVKTACEPPARAR
mmetsp:Transcript_34250/g.75206  ORF Transcript_34250/g.75206 Transcript_34250/m.75206 type:complete len:232 (-) Transcript_34250:172-867(-)